MICSQCGEGCPEESVFCPNCGNRLKCPNCGGPVERGRLGASNHDLVAGGLRWFPGDGSRSIMHGELLSPGKSWPISYLEGDICRNCRTVVLRF